MDRADVVFIDRDHDCMIHDISQGGAALQSAVRPAMGHEMTLNTSGVSGIPCRVVRLLPDGFAVQFKTLPAEKQRELDAWLQTLVSKPAP